MGQIRIPRISAHQVKMPVEEGFTRCGWGSDFWNHDHGDSCWNDRIVFGFTEPFSVPWLGLFRISFLQLPQARAEIFVLEDMTRKGNAVMWCMLSAEVVTEETPRRTDSQTVARPSVSQRPPRLKSWNSIIPFSSRSTHFMKDLEVQEAEEADSGWNIKSDCQNNYQDKRFLSNTSGLRVKPHPGRLGMVR